MLNLSKSSDLRLGEFYERGNVALLRELGMFEKRVRAKALTTSSQAHDGQRPAFLPKYLAAAAMIEYTRKVGTSITAGAVWLFGAEQAVPARVRKSMRSDGVRSKHSSLVGVR